MSADTEADAEHDDVEVQATAAFSWRGWRLCRIANFLLHLLETA